MKQIFEHFLRDKEERLRRRLKQALERLLRDTEERVRLSRNSVLLALFASLFFFFVELWWFMAVVGILGLFTVLSWMKDDKIVWKIRERLRDLEKEGS